MLRRLLTFSAREVELGRLRAALLVLFVGASGLLIGSKILRTAAAAQLARSTSTNQLHLGLLIDPANPDLYQGLGVGGLKSYAGPVASGMRTEASPEAIITYLRRAVELTPRNPTYWSDLAIVCDVLGDNECAETAFGQALKLSPKSPRLRWLAANHYIQIGRNNAALEQFRQLLVQDPSYARPTFRVTLELLGDPAAVQEKLIPPQANAALKLAFIGVLMEQGKADFAYQVWRQSTDTAPPFSLVRPYLDRLLEMGRVQEAQAIWQDLEIRRSLPVSTKLQGKNLVYNGDFEALPLNAGFDWHYRPAPFLALDFGDRPAYRGYRCLRLEFTVEKNLEYEPAYQLVPVAANRTYILSAYVRSDALTSDSGPRLRVVDALCSGCLDASSDGVVGTTPWHPVDVKFSTGPTTQLIRVSIWRPRARTFPTEISGTFWLDSVSVKPVETSALVSASSPGLSR